MADTGNWAVDELLKAEEEANNIIKNAQSERYLFFKIFCIFGDFPFLFIHDFYIFRKNRDKRLKEAKISAEQEINLFKKEEEDKYQKLITEVCYKILFFKFYCLFFSCNSAFRGTEKARRRMIWKEKPRKK